LQLNKTAAPIPAPERDYKQMKKSRLIGAPETRKKIEEEAEQEPGRATPPPPAIPKAGRKKVAKKSANTRKKPATPPTEPAKRSVGRPPGKRSSADYQSVTTFIRRDTYSDVMSALWEDKKKHRIKRGFGDLLEELLTRWLKGRK
jgi:hypothetical protein